MRRYSAVFREGYKTNGAEYAASHKGLVIARQLLLLACGIFLHIFAAKKTYVLDVKERGFTMSRILEAISAATGGSRTIGEILYKVGEKSQQAAELIEQDLANAEMGLDKCFEALKAYAREHATNGFWACPVFKVTTKNEAVRVILDFYHIPHEWLDGESKPKNVVKVDFDSYL